MLNDSELHDIHEWVRDGSGTDIARTIVMRLLGHIAETKANARLGAAVRMLPRWTHLSHMPDDTWCFVQDKYPNYVGPFRDDPLTAIKAALENEALPEAENV